MLCLSDFELYSRWVPLSIIRLTSNSNTQKIIGWFFFEKLIRRVWHQILFASQLGLDLEGVTFPICSSLKLCQDYFIAPLSCGSSFAFQPSSLLILGKK